MAYNESGALSPSQDYTLGNYTFQLRSNYDGDEDVTGIVARMTINGQTSVKGIDIDGQATVESWSVEANEDTADVYVTYVNANQHIQTNSSPGDVIAHVSNDSYDRTFTRIGEGRSYAMEYTNVDGYTGPLVFAESASGVWYHCEDTRSPGFTADLKSSTAITSHGKTFYYQTQYGIQIGKPATGKTIQQILDSIVIVNGQPETDIIARFAIDIHEAGGEDPEEWDEPIDYEEGWEEGDPTHTLNVTIKGATSGRHNDPLNDTSYSYLPADNTTQKAYGCGGDGGYGGGGGAGASTVIVYKFATDKANSKKVTAIARGHGYGSGGGKGGKGGDGCIIVYY